VQQQWKQVGVDVELQTLETNTFFDRLTKRDFEAALSGWAVALAPDLSPIWAGDSPFNFVSYQNPTVTRLIQRALAQPTAEQAAPTWRAAAERIVADQPYTWLYFFDQVDGVNERLKGMRVDTYGAYQNAWEWWIPKNRQRTRSAAAASRAADTPSSEKRQ
jgi:ABC-type transport system substrate-binding protein